ERHRASARFALTNVSASWRRACVPGRYARARRLRHSSPGPAGAGTSTRPRSRTVAAWTRSGRKGSARRGRSVRATPGGSQRSESAAGGSGRPPRPERSVRRASCDLLAHDGPGVWAVALQRRQHVAGVEAQLEHAERRKAEIAGWELYGGDGSVAKESL